MKDVNTPRNELICGKIDACIEAVQKGKLVDAIDYLGDIRYDAQRMEQKLIARKKQCASMDFWETESEKLARITG